MTWLSPDGLAAAACVGAAVWWGLGWRGAILLLAFFISGSVLTRLATGRGARRTARQVVANGGAAALAALVGSWSVTAGALAAAAADTWATEVGLTDQPSVEYEEASAIAVGTAVVPANRPVVMQKPIAPTRLGATSGSSGGRPRRTGSREHPPPFALSVPVR